MEEFMMEVLELLITVVVNILIAVVWYLVGVHRERNRLATMLLSLRDNDGKVEVEVKDDRDTKDM